MMLFRPLPELTEKQIKKSMNLVIGDGLAAEAMITLTTTTFLTALALLLGASNFDIGILAALPTFTNIFQLFSVFLVRRYNNRKAISVIGAILARLPLVAIGLAVWFGKGNITMLFTFLFFYYFFGSLGGPSWNAWMKDLIPGEQLGTYFSRRTRYMQTLNVVLSLALALGIDMVKKRRPGWELSTYGIMFFLAGVAGLAGAILLSRACEPKAVMDHDSLLTSFRRPLQDKNFKKLLVFNGVWAFALNMSTPFFVVFMLRTLQLSMTYIIMLGILSLLAGILTVQVWGRYSDRYSNKTIIAITAPLYIVTLIAWCYLGVYHSPVLDTGLLLFIHILTGISLAGVNLSVTNIGLKLAPDGNAIVYLVVRDVLIAAFTSFAPMIGGKLADYFVKRHLDITLTWKGPHGQRIIQFISLHEWSFLFLLTALLAILSLEVLSGVKEEGEVEKDVVVRVLRSNLRNHFKENFVTGSLIDLHVQVRTMIRRANPFRKERPETDLPES